MKALPFVKKTLSSGKEEVLVIFILLKSIIKVKPDCLTAKDRLDLLKKLLNKVPESNEEHYNYDHIACIACDIIHCYAKNQGNMKTVMDCGFNIEND